MQLINKYRPASFEEVIGNEKAVKALKTAVNTTKPHSYLFLGPSGVGKTTLARVVAAAVNATVLEIDAASNSGIDDVKQLISNTAYKPIDGNPIMIIIDECHALSKQAWQPLLKTLEEPPDYIFIALCTTEVEKVPATIKTRVYTVNLNKIKVNELSDLITMVATFENWKVSASIVDAISYVAEGSARKAISYLEAGRNAVDVQGLGEILAKLPEEQDVVIEICRLLVQGVTSWPRYQDLLLKIPEDSNLLSAVPRYITNVLIKTEDEKKAAYLWSVLYKFTEIKAFDPKSHLLAWLGAVLWMT